MSASKLDIIKSLALAQDDNDTVMLPNACKGELIELSDGVVRCFSILTRQPHSIPPESWTMLQTGDMPTVTEHTAVQSGLLVDHVTCNVIGNNAFRLTFDEHGAVTHMRLLPPDSGPAQQQWEAQAQRMLTQGEPHNSEDGKSGDNIVDTCSADAETPTT